MAAADAGNIIYFADIDTRASEIKKCRLRSYGNGGGMTLLCWTKIVFHAQVSLNGAALEPASATFGKLARFWQLDHAQDIK